MGLFGLTCTQNPKCGKAAKALFYSLNIIPLTWLYFIVREHQLLLWTKYYTQGDTEK